MLKWQKLHKQNDIQSRNDKENKIRTVESEWKKEKNATNMYKVK